MGQVQETVKTDQPTDTPVTEKVKLIGEEQPGVDFCVMLDCTASMGSYINMSREKIKDIIKQVKDLYDKSEIRVAVIAYRDIGDKPGNEVYQFSEDIDKAKAFLDKQGPSGGGDAPEDVNGAFQLALYSLEWKNSVRIIVHVADAPCHGTQFHDYGSGNDYHPKGAPGDASWDTMFKDLVEKCIDYTFLKINPQTDKMFEMFKKMAIANGAEECGITFTQELATGDNAAAGGVKTSAADGFAGVISDKIKGSLEKEFLKKGLKKRLDKRTEENAELVTKIKASITDIVAKMDFEGLKAKHGDLVKKVGECILSSNNFVDALADEDCLCLTFDIGRSQAAIMDPTQIIIKNVYPSFLTAGSFFFSTEYALKKDKLAHGGYEKHAEGMILKGAAAENITGVMPLYFCDENWLVAKQLMKITLGWDVTLEPAGYAYLQMKTVPFLILAKLAQMKHEKPGSEFLEFQFELVKKTCLKIMEDGSKPDFERKFNEEVLSLYDKYVEDPNVRTIDSIASNSVFLAQLYIAFELDAKSKGEDYFDQLFLGLLEEELRRKQYQLPEDLNETEWLIQLINVNVEEHITKPFQQFVEDQKKQKSDGVPEYELNFLQVLKLKESGAEIDTSKTDKKDEETKKDEGTKEDTKTEEKVIKSDPRSKEIKDYSFSFKKDGANYNEAQLKALNDYKITLKKVMDYLYPLRMLLTTRKAEDPYKPEDWGFAGDYQFFALYIQNKLQSKNANRREAITTGTYRNPWTQAEEYIKGHYNRIVENEKASSISKYLNDLKSSKSGAQAAIFATTDNLNEAAGAFLGAFRGCNIADFLKRLVDSGVTKAKEKIEMVLSGRYKGVNLVLDYQDWVLCRRNSNLILRAHTHVFTVDEWMTHFPKLSRTYVTKLLG